MIWQPIESAPKDGTIFLAWMSPSWIEGMLYSDGILCYSSDGDGPTNGKNAPTYWMPMPEPPKS